MGREGEAYRSEEELPSNEEGGNVELRSWTCRKNRVCIIIGCIALCLSIGIYRVQEF
jgi:hypothetical protein